jgi:uncharacterized protein (DUF433 family)
MTPIINSVVTIIRTERGLTISGTRISLYDVMDLLKAAYPPKLIADRLNLTPSQLAAALDYIAANRLAVDAEYETVLATREEIRQYWEDRNRDHFTQLASRPRKPEQAALWAKLEAQKAARQSAAI